MTTAQAARIQSGVLTSTSPAPSSITRRKALDELGQRQGLMNGWSHPGNGSDEKKTPENSHIGSMTRFIAR